LTRPLTLLTAAATALVLTAGLAVTTTQGADAAATCARNADATTPSVAVQDACGNHAMGGGDQSTAEALKTADANGVGVTRAQATPNPGSNVKGFDVSWYQGDDTDWNAAVSGGYKFVFIKSTEGTTYTNSFFDTQWTKAGQAGLLRGVYHFARPSLSSGSVQAQWFYHHGASMSATSPGTLPPVLDAEASGCEGLSVAAMNTWLTQFLTTLQNLTGRAPIIYTYRNWWNTCTGGNTALASKYVLWVADPTPDVATQPRMPSAWKSWSFWQYGTPPFTGGGDANVFNGTSLATLTAGYGRYPRISGPDRYATSAQAAQQFLGAARTSTAAVKPGQTVYIASGTEFPDALTGGAAAGKAQAPILLVNPDALLPNIIVRQLLALHPAKIVILGGTGAVPASLQTALASYTQSQSASSVVRIGGADRYGTSAEVATAAFDAGVANAYIAVGSNWPDALAGASAAAGGPAAGPVLLVEPDAIPTEVQAALKALTPKKITIFGGTGVVSAGVQKSLAAYTASRAASSVVRIGGADRYATSAAIATTIFGAGVSAAYVASGQNFPDALSGAPLASLSGGAPMLLTRPTAVPAPTASALAALKPKSLTALGGVAGVGVNPLIAMQEYVAQ
jgi:GH25 family lysozyme M1 (1,4-beta-N-acetylmuramidase)/putative cell wall-binding protein